MPEMTQKDTPNKTKHRKKNRESHNEVERHRKKKINSGINRIGDLIPCSPALKQSKNMILDQAFKYITELKRQNDELLLNGGNKEQACEIRKLRKELADIQKENGRYIELLKSNDICLYDDPTLHWKGKTKNSKAALLVSADQVQKFPLCLNGNQLASSNSSTAVHGITFNVSHNLQKQTANVVPVQRTCNLVTPITISGVSLLEGKTWHQGTVTSSSHNASLCLPLTTPAPSTLDVATSKGESLFTPTCSASHFPTEKSTAANSPPQPSNQAPPGESRVQIVGEQPTQNFVKSAASDSSSIPSIAADVPLVTGSRMRSQEPESHLQGQLSGAVSATGKQVAQEISPNASFDSCPKASVTSKETTSVEIEPRSVTAHSAAPPQNTWSLSALPALDLKSIGGLSRVSSEGNTQTTWTTLQVAGSTIQPLSQSPASVVPVLVTEPQLCPAEVVTNKQMTPCLNVNSLSFPEGKPVEQVIVKMSSCQPVQVQSVISQPPPANKLLPLNPPMQVIQVAQTVGPTLNPAPANPNIIFLQPPAPAPCSSVIRAEVPKPALSQQIVIIQTAPNQNPLPLMSAQPTPSVVVPINPASSVTTSSNAVQSTAPPQTFGGKNLVHILPRPSTIITPTTTQSAPASTATSNQQPPTISLNGQLFALQPVTPSAGSSNQTQMHIIQPTTSEDPNTNVALNTFGALANLSQSISHTAGQSCLQLTLNPSAAPVPTSSGTSISPSTTENSPVISLPTKSVLAKPKKAVKKQSSKKAALSKKEDCSYSKVERNAATSAESLTQSASSEAQNPDNTSVLKTPTQEKISLLDVVSPKERSTDSVCESNALSEANPNGLEPRSVPKSACSQPFPEDFALSKTLASDAETCFAPDEPLSTSMASGSFKSCVITDVSSASINDHPSQGPTAGASTPQAEIHAGGYTEAVGALDNCVRVEDSSGLTATDLLDVQILSNDPKGKFKLTSIKKPADCIVDHELMYQKNKSKELQSVNDVKHAAFLNTVTVPPAQNLPCTSDQDLGSSGVATRQTDSPLSTSSCSGRNFSVASMLPDTSRGEVSSGGHPAPAFTGCTFAEQNDIVAVATRAIFDQENHVKERAPLQPGAPETVPGTADIELLAADCRSHYKPQSKKESFVQLPPKTFPSVDPNLLSAADQMEGKNNCPVSSSGANLSLHISKSQSQNITSLSINNLVQPGSITHSTVNFANVTQTAKQVTLSASAHPAVSSGGCESRSSAALSEYSQEQLHSMRTTITQVTYTTESLLKPSDDQRKDSNKRAAHEDALISTAKRQKQCQASLRMGPPDGLAEQNEIMVSHVPSSTATSVSGSNPGHGDGLATLFSSSNGFARQNDMRCNSQTSIAERQQGQIGSQHLQPLLQHSSNQQVPLHHNSNPYVNQQQQAPHLQDQLHLYPQQRHVAHSESSIHQQSRNVQQQQQRLMQQDIQMQKKRPPMQTGQNARLSLQQKQHLSEQNRPKGTPPHSHHQQIQQQMQPHFGPSQTDKACENTTQNHSRHGTLQPNHVSQDILHQHQQDVGSRQQGSAVSSEHLSGHNQVQRLMTSRSLEQQQLVSQPSIVSRPPNMTCTPPHRQERNRVSSYSAEALIGKSTSNSEQRMGISVQGSRVSEQLELRKYLDVSRSKGLTIHNMQSRLSIEHTLCNDAQRLPDCHTFKSGGSSLPQAGGFDVQTSRNNDGNTVPTMRGMQPQTYRVSQNPNIPMDQQKHLSYQPVPEVPLSNTLPIRDNDSSCHQSFMQSLLAPHIGEQVSASQRLLPGHPRNAQYNTSSGVEYSCPPSRDAVHLRREADGQNRESCDLAVAQVTSRSHSLNIPFSSSASSGDVLGRNISPNPPLQKSNTMRPPDAQGTKNHLNIQVSINMHGVVHSAIPQQPVSHGNLDQRQAVRQANPPVTQRSRHPLQEEPDLKGRQQERNRPGNQRHSNMFEPTLPHLPLTGPGSMILGRQQPVTDKRPGIVRFMPDAAQVSGDNPAADQHSLTQNFGFPFIPEGTMNPPINANPSFIPPVTQTSSTRTPALIPVDPQNTLPSFYPPYSPAHPSLSNDLTIPYFPNQMFPNPSTEKPNSAGLNNRFGSILSPPRPVGFSQTTFPLLPDMPPMHMANPSHLSNFNLTSLFPEIATALPADGSAMSPLLSISHSSGSDSSKQSSNRPAHNISHILGHDSSSAV